MRVVPGKSCLGMWKMFRFVSSMVENSYSWQIQVAHPTLDQESKRDFLEMLSHGNYTADF